MHKLARYYRPYIAAIAVAIALLFVQVNMDLALPDYLSRMVNVGIQQSGIESPIPAVMRQSSFDAMTMVIDDQWREQLQRSYAPSADTAATIAAAGLRLTADAPDLALVAHAPATTAAAATTAFDDDQFMDQFLRAWLIVTAMQNPAAMQNRAVAAPIAAGESPAAAPPPAAAMALFDQALDPAVIRQAAIRAVDFEYQQIGVDRGALQNRYIFSIGAMMLLFTLISAATTIMVSFIGGRVSAGVARNVRGDLFRTVEGFSAAEIDRFSTASLITRSTNDITQVQNVTFMIIRMVLFAPIMGVGGVIRALGRAPSMSWLIAVAVILLLGIIAVVMSIALPKFKLIQKLIDRLNRVAREQLTGIMVVRAFNRQQFEADRFDAANKDLTDTNLFVMRVMVVLMPIIMLIMNGLSIAIIWVGADQIAASTMQVGDMMAFLQYAMQIIMSFLMLTMVFIILPRASVSAGRIAEVLDTKSTITDPPQPRTVPSSAEGRLEFRAVTFAYPGADDPALRAISFVAEPGKTTAIIGPTGSGKSSLVNLIPRLYDVVDGQVLIDEVDVRELTQHDLRAQIGFVPQKSTLFSGSLKYNLTYGDESADLQTVERAVATARVADFVAEREEGLDAHISQGGTNVSGGQRQRLSIARAIVKKPRILVFDDSFSALDFRTDAQLRHALREDAAGTTLIIVAQRVATVMYADQILVLDEGVLVGRGTHAELVRSCSAYREIVVSQLGPEAVPQELV